MNLESQVVETNTTIATTTTTATMVSAETKVVKNPIVVDRIGCWLPAEDLLALRLTCHAWNSSFIPSLRRRHRPIRGTQTAAVGGQKFIKCMRFSDKIPFGKYNVVDTQIALPPISWWEFGPVCGQLLTSLRISCGQWFGRLNSALCDSPFDYTPNLQELELVMEPNFDFSPAGQSRSETQQLTLKKLKRFSFASDARSDSTTSSVYTKCVVSVLQIGPELQVLEFPSCLMTYSEAQLQRFVGTVSTLGSVFTQIRDGRDSSLVKINKLQRLSIGDLQSSSLSSLIELGHDRLALRTLSVGLAGCKWTEPSALATELLTEFLATQAATLKDLTFELNGRNSYLTARANLVISIVLPQLDSLQSLAITQRGPRDQTKMQINFELRFFNGGTFASNCPALTKLKLYKFCYNSPSITFLGSNSLICHPRLHDLSLEVSVEQLAMLPVFYPAVTRLNLIIVQNGVMEPDTLLDGALGYIWTLWPGLMQLRLDVRLDSVTFRPDSFLTGIPRAAIPQLNEELIDGVNDLSLDGVNDLVAKYKTSPGISDLKRLQEFELTWTDNFPSAFRGQLTHIGVCFGLALAAENSLLHCITIHGAADATLSTPCQLSEQ